MAQKYKIEDKGKTWSWVDNKDNLIDEPLYLPSTDWPANKEPTPDHYVIAPPFKYISPIKWDE